MAQPNRRVALVAALGALMFAAGSATAAPAPGDMTLGDPKAKVQMVEYASLSCVHCAHFNNEVFPAFRKKYIDSGKVHYTFREILTPPNEVAAAGFMVARCAGKDRYFAVLDAMFHEFDTWAKSGDVRASLLTAGKAGGLSEQQVMACVADDGALDTLQTRVAANVKQGDITGTPTFSFNGVTHVGPMTAAELDAAVAKASKK